MVIKNELNCCVVIPARFKSSRFPGKPLVKLNGKPLIIRVAELASKAVGAENVFVATDDLNIATLVSESGYKYILTDENNLTGTDRVAQASCELDYDIIVNLQGDEPLIKPGDILKCIEEKKIYPEKVINGYTYISDKENVENINIPKVLINEQEKLIYISRSVLPGLKDSALKPDYFLKQVCIYVFSKADLKAFKEFGRKSKSEMYEDIEILRFFELNIDVKMVFCTSGSLAVDTPEDVIVVEKAILENEAGAI